ncbi:MAG TPA: flavin reductase [Pseudoflavonifractor sp.]|jgi:flavin reductase (DIM6/NTAB) family NADH-FMN oxidoreductase RutF|nr:flavin reductase [Pseudoflavonifractor sp.]
MFVKIDPKTLDGNVFSMLDNQWMLITAGTKDHCNTMTASWGGLGVIWSKCAATCYIRPQRYTREFVDREENFTLAFFGEEHRKALSFCGSRSGREVDKAAECAFTVAAADCGAPYFEEAELVLVCKKLYTGEIDPAGFHDEALREKNYPGRDYHKLYIGEIVEVLKKQ